MGGGVYHPGPDGMAHNFKLQTTSKNESCTERAVTPRCISPLKRTSYVHRAVAFHVEIFIFQLLRAAGRHNAPRAWSLRSKLLLPTSSQACGFCSVSAYTS